jgi:DNA-binding CsgD family transcriptional regulator
MKHVQTTIISEMNRKSYTDSDAKQLATRLGLTDFAYLTARLPTGCNLQPEDTFRTSYDPSWVDRYKSKKYRLYDPVIDYGQKSRHPFFWGHGKFLRRFRKSQKLVFHEAKEFGIMSGYAVPIYGPDGDAGLFTVVSDRTRDVQAAVADCIAEIELFAHRYHNTRIEELAGTRDYADIRLSARERECLLWTSEGLTTEAIADQLNLTVSAVNYHFTNANKKLNASNKHHAAIIALSTGLL